jgi:hypothetical protein
MRIILSWLLLFSVFNVSSQESITTENTPEVKVDSLYREDQFYFGITYNILRDKPSGLSQSKFSSGLTAGFLRDMPINKNRTVAIAAGMGFTYTNFNQNIAIATVGEGQVYNYIDAETDYRKNKFSLLSIDLPLEFRWRTSTYESHKFWRIYGGFKLSYLLYDRSIFSGRDGSVIVTGNNDFNKIQYGTYISAGYNTINLYAYYGLNSLFKSATVNGEPINMKALNIGIIFYIL